MAKLSTSEHPYRGATSNYITIRTIVAGDCYGMKDILKANHFRWDDRFGWWTQDRHEQPRIARRQADRQAVRLAKEFERVGVVLERGPHTVRERSISGLV